MTEERDGLGGTKALVEPSRTLAGILSVPGDKSVSHRVAMLSALAAGESTIRGFLRSEDCLNTLKALGQLGAGISFSPEEVRIRGMGGHFTEPAGSLDMGNSGTGMRLMAGFVAGQPFTCELRGDASLLSRPMRRIQDPLERMGARVELLGAKGCGPIRITGGSLRGIEYALPMASAQVKSCILLAALFAAGRTVVTEPRATRDHTERLLIAMGIPVEVDGLQVALDGFGSAGPSIVARSWAVPGDFSSAAFWIAAAAARPGAHMEVRGVGLNPRRTALLDVLRRMGARIATRLDPAASVLEPTGTVIVEGGALRGTDVGGEEIPNLIDEIPLVAVAGALAEGQTRIRDAAELRVKESDRIATMARNLRVLGVTVTEFDDGMTVEGAPSITGGVVSSYGDHRVAMALTVLGFFAKGPVSVHDVDCVATSYPEFWDDAERVGGHVRLRHSG